LRQAEQVATGAVQEHFLRERQTSRRAGLLGLNLKNFRRERFEQVIVGIHGDIEAASRREKKQN
jgi:hypothetical protein